MTENEAFELGNKLYANITSNANNIIETDDYIQFVRTAIKALEKQIPKKPVKSEKQVVRHVNTYYCPICNLGITGTNIAKWCYHCGQKLDWS